jgi:hypothetical protein
MVASVQQRNGGGGGGGDGLYSWMILPTYKKILVAKKKNS